MFVRQLEKKHRPVIDEQRGIEVSQSGGAFDQCALYFHLIGDPNAPLTALYGYKEHLRPLTDDELASGSFGPNVVNQWEFLIIPTVQKKQGLGPLLPGCSRSDMLNLVSEALTAMYSPWRPSQVGTINISVQVSPAMKSWSDKSGTFVGEEQNA